MKLGARIMLEDADTEVPILIDLRGSKQGIS